MVKMKVSIQEQLEIIKRGAVDIISEDELRKKLEYSVKSKKPLNIKAGFDPTAPDLHLGHTVLLRKLKSFQDLGHKVFFLIGDFTARIGDPTGRSELRKTLTKEEALANAATYKKQVSRVLDIDRLHIVFNSDWFDKMTMLDTLKLTTHATVAQMLSREDFKKRFSANENISLLEFMYPVLQGYDSVKLEADIELGGTDQVFNLLVGRDIQKDYNMSQQVVLTMPLLEGTDGIQKMSKSYANYIGINEPPKDMFGKLMSISDDMMLKYYTLLTNEDLEEVKSMHPKEAKLKLATLITASYHGRSSADKAREDFERTFSKKELPQDAEIYKLKGDETVIDIIISSGMAASRNEARRLIQQGGVTLGSERIDREDSVIDKEGILKVGKRRFLKIVK